jgi:hypothetical protein
LGLVPKKSPCIITIQAFWLY